MPRVALVLVALALAGCASPDAGGFDTLHVVHDFAGNPRATPFDVSTSTDTITARLEVVAAEPGAPCAAVEPVRIVLLDATGKEALVLAPDDPCGGAVVERTLTVKAGKWTLAFHGQAPLQGVADLEAHRGTDGARLA